ncbi:hypothetical protein A0H81_01429 [Grifola frondosa]|uniref:RRM domain-containing protein n=1 Tax=Grifola frondosa TaxID=5627 RepID=A0A1C7MRX8_GRIFR|nr:hypothetical protein A0H81_01429 [Grifola frondosa]
MPPKSVVKDRAWGTRYDGLESSSPPSPFQPISNSPITSIAISPSRTRSDDGDASIQTSVVSKTESVSHDASIFVGSLPTNVDYAELTRLLSEHLTQHAEIKAVKVVRDSRGGVCAFVQCEVSLFLYAKPSDTCCSLLSIAVCNFSHKRLNIILQDISVASRLLDTLRSLPPRPFLGRFLRYEPARPARTLLVSFCAPKYAIARSDAFDDSQDRQVQPAKAMRIFKPRGAKFLTVIYDEEAQNFDISTDDQIEGADPRDAFIRGGLLFSPLKYNAEMVSPTKMLFHSIMMLIRNPTAGRNDEENANGSRFRPYPHDAPRLPGMDTNIWEVKWRNREDCVNAFMTLRRIPHFNVTWAHHPRMQFGPGLDSRFSSPALLYSPQSYPHGQHGQHMRTQSHPHSSPRSDHYKPCDHDAIWSSTAKPGPLLIHSKMPRSPVLELPNNEPWTFAHSTPFLGSASPSAGASSASGSVNKQQKSLDWSENDFPPLGLDVDEGTLFGSRRSGGSWSDCDPPAEAAGFKASSGLHASLHSSVYPSNSPTENTSRFAFGDEGIKRGRDEYSPPTPGFSVSPITPLTPRTSQGFPQTPQSATSSTAFGVTPHYDSGLDGSPKCTPKGASRFGGMHESSHFNDDERELDPTTIFVGGLEISDECTWDEPKLYQIFGRFGGIETIQIVRPVNKRTAFAFVKFNNVDSPARAILEEHNRIYEGRQIRVQLRDRNPPQRSPWRHSRGRGRLTHSSGPTRLHVDAYGGVGGGLGLKIDTKCASNLSGHSAGLSVRGMHTPSPAREGQSAVVDFSAAGSDAPSRGLVDFAETSRSSISSSTTKVASSPFGGSHDTARVDASSASSLPSNPVGPSVSVTGPIAPYSMINVGYFPPQPWIHAYPTAYPYAVPFVPGYGYPGYPMPGMHHTPHAFNGSQIGISPAGGTNTWASASSIQKPAAPFAANDSFTANEETPSPGPQQSDTQPPLRPTGFIQGEHGTLIPVYHPEALGQYMANAHPGQAPQSQLPPPVHQSQHHQGYPQSRPAQAQNLPAPASSGWGPYPQMPTCSYTAAPAPVGAPNVQHMQNSQARGWIPSPAPYGFPAGHQAQMHPTPPPYLVPVPPSGSFSPTSFRGGYPV